jgi:hypothetical protein
MNSRNSENHQIESDSRGLLGKCHQAKRHTVLICDAQQEYLKETPQNVSMKITRKGPKNHQKGKTGETTQGLEESRRTFYTYQERFIQGLACFAIIHSSLKISP